MGKAVEVHKNSNVFKKGPILILMSVGDPFL